LTRHNMLMWRTLWRAPDALTIYVKSLMPRYLQK
jgi:hypothetical protein